MSVSCLDKSFPQQRDISCQTLDCYLAFNFLAELCWSCFSHETKLLFPQQSQPLNNSFTGSNHVLRLFLTLVRAVQRFVNYLLIFIWTFCLFWFLQFQTYLLWAAPSLHPSYTIKFSLQIPLSISKPSFCSGAALVHFPPHFSAPEVHTFGCVIEIKQSKLAF